MKKVNCVFLIGFILFLNLISLNSSFSYQSTNTLESASDSADDPLKVGTTSLGYDLDPAFARDGASSNIIDQVWEGLYAHNLGDSKLRIVPRLAADCGSWNEDATVFNVTLRSGITFHNGEPFTAADVNYTFSRLWELCVFHYGYLRDIYFPYGFNTTEMNASVGYGYIINKTVIVDDLHVSFELNFPYSPFQSLLCFSGSYIVDESTTKIDEYLEFGDINNETAIGTGPYKITEHSYYNCTFEYWEDYYRGTPAIKEIEFVKYSSSKEISKALIAGDIDIAHRIDEDFMKDFEKNPEIYVGPYSQGSGIRYLEMNNVKINRTYRHAINYAIDRDEFLNEIYGEKTNIDQSAKRMTSIVSPGITYHKDCDVSIFNITKSRQILIDAGYTEGYGLDLNSTDDEWKNVAESANPLFTIKYRYLNSEYRENIGIVIRDSLADIGIHISFDPYGIYSKIYEWNFTSESDIYLATWLPDYNDPGQFINLLWSNTYSWFNAHVNDPWLQLAMDEALTTTNDDELKALYYDIQDYIATDLMPIVFLEYGLSRSVRANYVITQPNPMKKFYIFPFSWHGVNTTFNDPYIELWCNSGSPPVLEYWPEPAESIQGYPIIVFSFCILVIIPLWLKKYKKQS